MLKICLVSCVKSKRAERARAENLYTSPLFIKARDFAINNFDKWFILSAKYGIVRPHEYIEPYEETLKEKPKIELQKWAEQIYLRLKNLTKPGDEITFIAGSYYRECLAPLLKDRGNKVRIPLMGKSIGKQLAWLNENVILPHKYHDLNEFYDLLYKLESGLGGKRLLKDCTGSMLWPERGVYFIFEPGEFRSLDAFQLRVIRVGTHMVSRNSKSTLWNRIHTHIGTTNGMGNHRASIFRLHVGDAIINKSEGKLNFSTWGQGQCAPAELRIRESELERQVSTHIKKMYILWLNIPDKASPSSDRAYIEKNSIGLISNQKRIIDTQSKSWLGNYSANSAIRKSGLWNINYTDYFYDKRFLSVLSSYIETTIGQIDSPNNSIAPRDWYLADKGKIARGQMFLFGEKKDE